MKRYTVPPLLRTIISRYKRVIFVSPHLDDAVFSAGQLITSISSYLPVRVISIFTQAGTPPYTLSAKKHLRICGYKNAHTLYDVRRREDISACDRMSADYQHLGLTDALWRQHPHPGLVTRFFSKIIPETIHLYPTYRLHVLSYKIPKPDPAPKLMSARLKSSLSDKTTLSFCPLAVNTHIDHLIVRNVCRQLTERLIYWLDYPYYRIPEKPILQFTDSAGLTNVSLPLNNSAKINLMRMYQSQFRATFPESLPRLPPERYYFKP